MRYYLIDKITQFQIGQRASGIKNITMSEDFLADHFPRHPIMPGALILEGLAQLSGVLLEYSAKKEFGIKIKAILSIVERAKFRQFVRPGDQLGLEAEIIAINRESGKIKASALLQDKVVTDVELLFVFFEYPEPELEDRNKELVRFLIRDLPDQELQTIL